jgi:hypothetical protein
MTLDTSYYSFSFKRILELQEINGYPYATISALQLAVTLYEKDMPAREVYVFSNQNTETSPVIKKIHEVVHGLLRQCFPLQLEKSYYIKATFFGDHLTKKVYPKLPLDTIFEATLVASQLRLPELTKKCYERILDLRDLFQQAQNHSYSFSNKNQCIKEAECSFKLLKKLNERESHQDIFVFIGDIMRRIIQDYNSYPSVKYFVRNYPLFFESSPNSTSPLNESPIMSYEEMKDEEPHSPLRWQYYPNYPENGLITQIKEIQELPLLAQNAPQVQYKVNDLSGKEHVYISDRFLQKKYPDEKDKNPYLLAINELIDSTTEMLTFNQCNYLNNSIFENLKDHKNIKTLKISNCPRLTDKVHYYLLKISSLKQVQIRCCDNITRNIHREEAIVSGFSTNEKDEKHYIVQPRGFSFSESDIKASKQNILQSIKPL